MNLSVPEPWASAMVARGFTHHARPSLTQLAKAADVTTETVRRVVHGIGSPDANTLAKVSAALGIDVTPWVGAKPVSAVFVGPDASRWLTARQRAAITDLIHAIVEVDRAEFGRPLALVADSGSPLTEQRIASQEAAEMADANQDPGGIEPA